MQIFIQAESHLSTRVKMRLRNTETAFRSFPEGRWYSIVCGRFSVRIFRRFNLGYEAVVGALCLPENP